MGPNELDLYFMQIFQGGKVCCSEIYVDISDDLCKFICKAITENLLGYNKPTYRNRS